LKRNGLVCCGALFALSILFMVGSAGITPMAKLHITSPGAYPLFVSLLCLLSAGAVTADTLKAQPDENDAPDWPLFSGEMLCFMALMFLYCISMNYCHYTLSTLLFTLLGTYFLNREGWKTSLLVSYVSTFLILLVFKHAFSVIMP